MIHKDLSDFTVDQLVDRYAEIGRAQYDALLNDQIPQFNQLFDCQIEIEEELRRRGVKARLALLRLYDHPNIQVRLNAAQATYRVAPEKAVALLEQIAQAGRRVQAVNARFSLKYIADGTSKLT